MKESRFKGCGVTVLLLFFAFVLVITVMAGAFGGEEENQQAELQEKVLLPFETKNGNLEADKRSFKVNSFLVVKTSEEVLLQTMQFRSDVAFRLKVCKRSNIADSEDYLFTDELVMDTPSQAEGKAFVVNITQSLVLEKIWQNEDAILSAKESNAPYFVFVFTDDEGKEQALNLQVEMLFALKEE